ncbi:MAG: hypothetical protein ACRDFX_04700 [Chloroflexota bacterium]
MPVSDAKFVQLQERDGQFVLLLLDADHRVIGHGYKGPTLKRAEQDLKYWMRDKGLERVT